MADEATDDELRDVLVGMPDLPTAELGEIIIDKGAVAAAEVNHGIMMGTSGDTLNLAEHHIYGSTRLGVQRYDSILLALPDANHLFVGNILNPETGDPVYNLNLASPWYSYSFQDLIDPSKRDPYGTSGNTFLGEWQTSRTLGRRYYEMTDHLGNVLATVLDRKTGALPSSGGAGGGMYDHWLADLASTADYYPGGMMMPGRNTEYSWSRMGAQRSPKDDEVYGKGNLIDMGDREMDR